MGAFDEGTITHGDVSSFQSAGLALQLAIVRQIDRILAGTGRVFGSKEQLLNSINSLRNMEMQIFFLSRFMAPYVKKMPGEVEGQWRELSKRDPRSYEEVKEYAMELANLFTLVVKNLGYVQLLPPITDELESGSD